MFEIHVLVNPTQEFKLHDSINIIQTTFPLIYSCKVMATVTSTGVNPRQPMISGFVNCDQQSAVDIGHSVEDFLVTLGFDVTRVKIEQLITFNTPETKYMSVSGDDYFEAHIKVGQVVPDAQEYKTLAMLCLNHGVQLLFNPYSIKIAPVTTMRLYDSDIAQFSSKHQEFINDLESHNFEIRKQHIERGVYDTNPFTDKGWLFADSDYKTPIVHVDCQERLQLPGCIAVLTDEVATLNLSTSMSLT